MKLLLASVAAMILFLSCNNGGPLAGGGSPSPNAINGRITGQKNAKVNLYKIDGNFSSDSVQLYWQIIKSGTTNDSGFYRFDSLSDGIYSIISFGDGGKSAFTGYTTLDSSSRVNTFSTTELKATLSVSGTLTDTSGLPISAIMSLVGTPYTDTTSADGSFNFDSLPEAPLRFQITALSSKKLPVTQGLFLLTSQDALQGSMSITGSPDADTVSIDSSRSSIKVPWNLNTSNAYGTSLTILSDTFTYSNSYFRIIYKQN
ncbi:MAG: hypothetical protein JNL74_00740 [Fibrobacteres bacterium]|nr:hypothetical protein [Fibrobacterota bacterium]